jgi:hypothetical protein
MIEEEIYRIYQGHPPPLPIEGVARLRSRYAPPVLERVFVIVPHPPLLDRPMDRHKTWPQGPRSKRFLTRWGPGANLVPS